MKIIKEIRKVTGNAIGVTFKKEDVKILNAQQGDFISIEKVSNSIREKKIENKKEVKTKNGK